MCLGGQGALLHWQRPLGKAPACPGCPWPPRAHLGGCSSLEAQGVGAVAIAEGSCLHHRVTPATTGCMSPAVQVAGCPLAQVAKGWYQQGSMRARELQTGEEAVSYHLAREPLGWAGPGRSSTAGLHRPQRQSRTPRKWGPQKEQLQPRVACSPVAERGEGEERCSGQQVGPFSPLEQE